MDLEAQLMHKWTISLTLLLALGAFAPTVTAASDESLDLDKIRAQQAEIRSDAKARTGLYEDMTETTRRELFSRQNRVLVTIGDKATAAQLTENQRLAVFNDLEWIEAAINKAEDEQMVCERRAILGSNRKERICMTVAQMREARERARDEMMRGDRNMRSSN
jgi:hypothetical protein